MLTEERAIQILQYIDQVFRQQLDHADKKAATIIAVAAAVLTFNRSFLGLDQPGLAMRMLSIDGFLTLALVLVISLSMTFSFLTITPRIRSGVRSILFWRTWMAEAEAALLIEKCRDPAFVKDEFIRDIQLVSGIVEQKMRWLRWSSILLYVALALLALLLVLKTYS
jgi:hypothetical protein